MDLKLPTEEEIAVRVDALHASPWMLYAATTGAAGGLREDLWRTPNASNTIISLPFPYDQRELDDFIRHRPEQYCSEETALRMASAAFAKGRRRVVERGDPNRLVLGAGMTAAVNPGNRPKKGPHRVFAAVKSAGRFLIVSATFTKGLLTRKEEGRICDLLVLDAVLTEAGVGGFDWSLPGVEVQHRIIGHEIDVVDGAGYMVDDTRLAIADLSPDRHVIYPGSFAPVHHGHEEVAETVEVMTGLKAVFQITSSHPTKGEVPQKEMAARLHQLRYRWPSLVLAKEGLYVEKARRLPGFAFIVGADALLGLLDPQYYGGSKGLRRALEEFQRLGTRFYVVGRAVDGEYVTLEDIPVPERHRHIFRSVSVRCDVSSTAIRNAK